MDANVLCEEDKKTGMSKASRKQNTTKMPEGA